MNMSMRDQLMAMRGQIECVPATNSHQVINKRRVWSIPTGIINSPLMLRDGFIDKLRVSKRKPYIRWGLHYSSRWASRAPSVAKILQLDKIG
mgnify:FL=1